jgi:hypothetical protein
VAVAFWIWWKRRDSTKKGVDESLPQKGIALEKYSIAIPPRSEMEGQNTINEMGAATEPEQLAAQHGISELEG